MIFSMNIVGPKYPGHASKLRKLYNGMCIWTIDAAYLTSYKTLFAIPFTIKCKNLVAKMYNGCLDISFVVLHQCVFFRFSPKT